MLYVLEGRPFDGGQGPAYTLTGDHEQMDQVQLEFTGLVLAAVKNNMFKSERGVDLLTDLTPELGENEEVSKVTIQPQHTADFRYVLANERILREVRLRHLIGESAAGRVGVAAVRTEVRMFNQYVPLLGDFKEEKAVVDSRLTFINAAGHGAYVEVDGLETAAWELTPDQIEHHYGDYNTKQIDDAGQRGATHFVNRYDVRPDSQGVPLLRSNLKGITLGQMTEDGSFVAMEPLPLRPQQL